MSRKLQKLTVATAIALLTGTAACSDTGISAPNADTPNPRLNASAAPNNTSRILSQGTVGDTIVTVFLVGAPDSKSATFKLGNNSTVEFPYGYASICNLTSSTYGPSTWDSDCSAAQEPVQVTAKTWTNAQGRAENDFQPAMRFRPNLSKSVMLYMKDAQTPGARIDYRLATGQHVQESLTDQSVATSSMNGQLYRIIKHFSGYTVTAD